MQIFKIRNAQGQFSKGGMAANTKWAWSSEGKSWSGSGPLRRHLAQYHFNRSLEISPDWVVVEITIDFSTGIYGNTTATAVVNEYPAIDFYNKTHI